MKRRICILVLALMLGILAAGRAETAPAEGAGIAAYQDVWVCDRAVVLIYPEADGCACTVLVGDADALGEVWSYPVCRLDEANGCVVCENGTKSRFSEADDAESVSEVELTGLSATFFLDGDDRLTWEEAQENAGDGLVFSRLELDTQDEGAGRRTRLGSSMYSMLVDQSFKRGTISDIDYANGEVGYFYSLEDPIEFYIYQYPGAGGLGDLADYARERALRDGAAEVNADDNVNGIPAAWYRAAVPSDDGQSETVTYVLNDADGYVEIVFWLGGDGAEEKMAQLLDSLTSLETKPLRLGTSDYSVTVLSGYAEGEMTDGDIAEGQVAYYACGETPVDFDVYQFAKAGLPDALAEYAAQEASEHPDAGQVTDGEINGIPIAWYRAPATYAGETYDTLTCILDDGDGYVKLVFWLDGRTAMREVNAIIGSLKRAEPVAVPLGDTVYTITLPAGFATGGVAEAEQVEEGKIGYWYSTHTPLEIEIFQYDVGGEAGDRMQLLAERAEDDEGFVSFDANGEINGIRIASYRAVRQYEEGEYATLTCMLEDGGTNVDIVFWLNGPTAEEEAAAIMQTLCSTD